MQGVFARSFLILSLCSALIACDSGGSSGGTGATFTLGGSVSGLNGTLALVNAGNMVTITAGGPFQFAQQVADGRPYHVMVSSQPLDQTCTITNASGAIANGPVSNVLVNCISRQYTIGGTVSGLSGTVRLQNNNGDDLIRTGNGAFVFTSSMTAGTTYKVAVQDQPAGQTCTVSNGTGTATGGNITNISIACVNNTTPYTIGGTISGLVETSPGVFGPVTLQNNGGNNLLITANGSFTLSAPLNTGSAYNVGLLAQPIGQNCSVSNGSGTALNNVSNIVVTCVSRTYNVRGNVSGLIGTVVLQNNGGDTAVRNGNGPFMFATQIAHGSAYDITVQTPPPGQSCTIPNGSGKIFGADANVEIECGPIMYSVEFTLTGLTSGALTLAINGTQETFSTNGTHVFLTRVALNSSYNVSIALAPIGQSCSVVNGSGSNVSANITNVEVVCGFVANVNSFAPQQLTFFWLPVAGAETYKVLKNPDGKSGFTAISGILTADPLHPTASITFSESISVHLHDWPNAQYIIEACGATTCKSSAPIFTVNAMLNAIGYFKASNTGSQDNFGNSVALSADGNTLAIGAPRESSNATGINATALDTNGEVSIVPTQGDNSAIDAGAVYVFTRNGFNWTQQAWIKASNTNAGDRFGSTLALSADGNVLAVGAPGEASNATGINGNQLNNAASNAGAGYLFKRIGSSWQQEAYLKASDTLAGDQFGSSLALAGDGNTLAIGAPAESSAATGIDGNQNDNSTAASGAVYVFTPDTGVWAQHAYVKASNTGAGDNFGTALALSHNGSTLAVGARSESSHAVGINDDQDNNSATGAGAVYVFLRNANDWQQQAYIKASNTGEYDAFGNSVALSGDGNTLAAGAPGEDSDSDEDPSSNTAANAGATYVFTRAGSIWSQQAYIKASAPAAGDEFGKQVALARDSGNLLIVSAPTEDATGQGVAGNPLSNAAPDSGAAYLFQRDLSAWSQRTFLKASNSEANDGFGASVAISDSGGSVVVGSTGEDSVVPGVGGNQTNNFAPNSGAVYLY